jgi:GIY-YIG catalytic domain
MQISFNDLLQKAGIKPAEVRLVRHQQDEGRGNTSYQLWIRDKDAFLQYESIQSPKRRTHFRSKFWASFVGMPSGETLFTGLSSIIYKGTNSADFFCPLAKIAYPTGTVDEYLIERLTEWEPLAGRLFIEWGLSERAWVQRADKQNKVVTMLLNSVSEPPFAGFSKFISVLSELESLPATWQSPLKAARGIYLLTCPKTKQQYVGSAYGDDGFWGRWMNYAANNHGGNVQLKSREKSNYQVSILETVSFATSIEEILDIETRWKQKLQSREIGLNSN